MTLDGPVYTGRHSYLIIIVFIAERKELQAADEVNTGEELMSSRDSEAQLRYI